MKQNGTLIVTSLLSILLLSIHISHDIIRGADTWGRQSLIGVLILVVLLVGTLMLAERRSGLIIMLVGGLMAAAMPVIHSRDRKSTRLNSSHGYISYAVFCLKKKKKNYTTVKQTAIASATIH